MNRTDFTMLETDAKIEEFDKINEFINTALEERNFSIGDIVKITVAVEEIFVNIAHYAYSSDNVGGYAAVGYAFTDEPNSVVIRFEDKGKPYNPLEKSEPETTISADERKIGGLGIYMVKRSMDGLLYEYTNGKNILTLVKNKSLALK